MTRRRTGRSCKASGDRKREGPAHIPISQSAVAPPTTTVRLSSNRHGTTSTQVTTSAGTTAECRAEERTQNGERDDQEDQAPQDCPVAHPPATPEPGPRCSPWDRPAPALRSREPAMREGKKRIGEDHTADIPGR